jgi:hypothetical protein
MKIYSLLFFFIQKTFFHVWASEWVRARVCVACSALSLSH